MGMSADDYCAMLLSVAPRGDAWPRDPETVFVRTLHGLALELARVEARAADLHDEADPRVTLELLAEWERAFGLPEPCLTPPDTTPERQAALHEKVTRIGGQSPQYYIDVAARLGFVITITEHQARRHGDPYNQQYADEPWAFVWDVNAPETTINERRRGDPYNEPYRDWGNQVLECVISRLAPAHTLVRFIYA